MSVSSRDDYQPGDLRARLTFPTSNNPSGGTETRIRIEDSISGTLLCELQLRGDQLAQLLGQQTVYIPAGLTAIGELSRVGKYRHTFSQFIPRTFSSSQSQEREDELVASLSSQGWEDVQIRRVQGGVNVVARRWEAEPLPEEV